MKRLVIISLMLIYGLSSSGMSVTIHYCCGKFDKISFSSKYEIGCGSQKQFTKKNCCDNREIELKLKTDQEPSLKQVINHSAQVASILPHYLFASFTIQDIPVNEYPNGPPLKNISQKLCIKNCLFRI